MTESAITIEKALLDEGWVIYPNSLVDGKMFCKSFAGYAKCKCNEPKNKQVEVYYSPSLRIGSHVSQESWRVENVGQLQDDQWVRMRIEGLENRAQIERAVWQLLKGWDYIVSISHPA